MHTDILNPILHQTTKYLHFDSFHELRNFRTIKELTVDVILTATRQGDQRLVEQVSDLIYHLLVLVAARYLSIADIETELNHRHSMT